MRDWSAAGRTALAVALVAAGVLGAAGQPADEGAVARRLVGMWRLVDRTVTFADGTTRPDPRTMAYILYSDTGITCYVAMDPGRAPWTSETGA